MEILRAGGFSMLPLVVFSLVVWAVIFERLWRYRKLDARLKDFHSEALRFLYHSGASVEQRDGLRALCSRHPQVPTSDLLLAGLERLAATDARVRETWKDAVERRRQRLNQELRQNLWMLGTIGSSAPFVGLFGTVVGILGSFREMSVKGVGGFAIVAAGISEALIATAAGIIVAVIAVVAYNAFQVRWSGIVLAIRLQTEELTELLDTRGSARPGTSHGA